MQFFRMRNSSAVALFNINIKLAQLFTSTPELQIFLPNFNCENNGSYSPNKTKLLHAYSTTNVSYKTNSHDRVGGTHYSSPALLPRKNFAKCYFT